MMVIAIFLLGSFIFSIFAFLLYKQFLLHIEAQNGQVVKSRPLTRIESLRLMVLPRPSPTSDPSPLSPQSNLIKTFLAKFQSLLELEQKIKNHNGKDIENKGDESFDSAQDDGLRRTSESDSKKARMESKES